MLKRLFTHTAIYGLAPYLPKLFGLVSLPLITEHLTSLDYGIAGIIAAYVGAIGVFNNAGLRLIIVNAYYHYQSQYKWVWRQVYGFLSLWVVVFAFLTGLLLYFIIPSQAAHNSGLIIVLNVVPLVLFGPVGMIGSTYYQLEQRPIPIALRTIIFGLLTIALNVYFIAFKKLGYMGWFWTEFIIGIAQNASYWYAVNVRFKLTPIFNFKWRLIRRSLKVALPTIPHYYSTYLLNSSDRMVMDFVKIPTDVIGRYNVAANFGNYFNSFSMAAGLAIGPMLNKLFKEGRELQARNLVWVLQVIFFIGTFTFSLWSKEIFKFLIRNDTLAESYPLAIIIVMSYNYRPMYFGSNFKIFYKEKTKLLWRITFIAGLLNVVLNLALVPVWGIKVAAITTFISYMYMGYIGFYFKENRALSNINYYPFIWLSATCMLAAVAYGAVELATVVKISMTIIMLSVAAFCVYLINKKLHEV